MNDVLSKWLAGEPVVIEDRVVVFPHGQREARRLLSRLSMASEFARNDRNALVRRLDVAINGEGGSAQQASLCDLVSQLEDMLRHHNERCLVRP